MAKRKRVDLKRSDIINILNALPVKGNESLILNLKCSLGGEIAKKTIIAAKKAFKIYSELDDACTNFGKQCGFIDEPLPPFHKKAKEASKND